MWPAGSLLKSSPSRQENHDLLRNSGNVRNAWRRRKIGSLLHSPEGRTPPVPAGGFFVRPLTRGFIGLQESAGFGRLRNLVAGGVNRSFYRRETLRTRFLSRSLPPEPTQFWVYILQNKQGSFYIGSTEDPERRLIEHNSDHGAKAYTHKTGPWELVWKEPHLSRSAAMSREKQIKSKKSAKWIRNHLLNGRAPTCRD
jgi:putative endonuclease